MAEANLSSEEQFISSSLLVGDFNAHDNSGRSLILIAALLNEEFNASHIPGCSSILAAAPGDGASHKMLLLEYFLERKDIPRIDKIDALEMAGAVILGNDDNHEKFPLGFQHWRRALALRMVDTEDGRPIFKTPAMSKNGQLSEWSSLDELDQIEKDPSQRVIQSLLVHLRIASSLCWEAVFDSFLPSFVDFLRLSTPNQCSMSQMLDVSWTTLDTILRCERPHEKELLHSVYEIEMLILVRFGPEASSFDLNSLNSENLQKLVEVLLMSDLTNPITNRETPLIDNFHMYNLCTMVGLLSVRPAMMTKQIRESLLELVRRDGRYIGLNFLHFFCLLLGEHLLPSIRFLVQLGVNPNARTNGDNCRGVLHLLAHQTKSKTRDAAARLLLDLGAHLDMADEEGWTAADYWLGKNNGEGHQLPDWLKGGVPKLKCLSARVIRRFKLPHNASNTPAVLIPFVELH